MGGLFVIFTGFNAFSEPSESVSASKDQTTPPSLIDPLESGRRLVSMTVITEEDIKRCPGCELSEILERAGVQVRRYQLDFFESSDTDVSYLALRGATDTQTLLVVDGLRQEDAMLSKPVWTFIPVHHIKRIEIVKGPSIIYGSPIGGVIPHHNQKGGMPAGKSRLPRYDG